MIDFVAERTKVDADGWFQIIEDLIQQHSWFPADGSPGITNFNVVWEQLRDLVRERTGPKAAGDENILFFHLIGRIALRWSLSILEVKSRKAKYPEVDRNYMSSVAARWRSELPEEFAMNTDPRSDADMLELYGMTESDGWPAVRAVAQADFDDYCEETMLAQMESDFWHNYNRGWGP